MRRRSWFLFQAVGCFVLIIAAPRALSGLVEDLEGPYEVRAASPPGADEAAAPTAARDRAAPLAVDADDPVSSP